MLRTTASIVALSVGLIVSGSVVAGQTTPAASQAEYNSMQNATLAANDVKNRSVEGRRPVEQGAKPTEPKEERMFNYPHSPAPGDKAYGERGDPGVANQKTFDYPERPAPGDKDYSERGDAGVADGPETADYPQRPAPGDVPYEARGSSIDENPEQAYAPMQGRLDETEDGPVTRHLPDETM
jgi:hypothetical protein